MLASSALFTVDSLPLYEIQSICHRHHWINQIWTWGNSTVRTALHNSTRYRAPRNVRSYIDGLVVPDEDVGVDLVSFGFLFKNTVKNISNLIRLYLKLSVCPSRVSFRALLGIVLIKFFKFIIWRYDTQRNDIQPNDIQHDNTQHNL